jgi:acyl-homoserine lactone acylase PvdQ
LSREQAEALVRALEDAATSLERSHGRIDVAWGDLHRVGRGDRSWSVGGCRDDGLGTLRSVRYGAPGDDGVAHATGGQICPTVVVLREQGVVSFSAPPFGQSNDPDSPHYTDQTEKLFSRGRLKPTWYDKTELLKHLRSERTLTLPVAGTTVAEGL